MKREIAQTDTNFSDLQGKLTGQVYIAISVKLTQVLLSAFAGNTIRVRNSHCSSKSQWERSVALVSDVVAVYGNWRRSSYLEKLPVNFFFFSPAQLLGFSSRCGRSPPWPLQSSSGRLAGLCSWFICLRCACLIPALIAQTYRTRTHAHKHVGTHTHTHRTRRFRHTTESSARWRKWATAHARPLEGAR